MSKAFFMMILLQINIIVYYNNAYNRLLKIQLLKQSYNMSASYRYVFLNSGLNWNLIFYAKYLLRYTRFLTWKLIEQ